MLGPLILIPTLTLSAAQSPGIYVWGEVTPTHVHLGDVVFMRISAHNRGDCGIKIPAACSLEAGSLSVEITDHQESTTFRFRADGCPTGGDVPEIVLGSGEDHVLAMLMLPIPQLDWTRWRFWNPQKWRRIGCELGLRCGEIQGRTATIYIDRRPDKEMERLLEYYDGGFKAAMPSRWDSDQPSLGIFGLVSFPLECSKPENLAGLEEALSEGSLRALVHATRLTQAVYRAQDTPKKRQATRELLAWLDLQDEIARQWIAIRLYSWCWHNRGLGTFAFELVDDVIRRLPEQLGAAEDYQDSARRQYLLDHPGAEKYWRKPIEDWNKTGTELDLKTKTSPVPVSFSASERSRALAARLKRGPLETGTGELTESRTNLQKRACPPFLALSWRCFQAWLFNFPICSVAFPGASRAAGLSVL